MINDNDNLVRKIKEVLDKSVQDIDSNILARLELARQCALKQGKQRAVYYPWLRWGVVPLTIVVLMLFLNPWGIEKPEPTTVVADLTLLTAVDNIDFFIEEIEFYQWLLEIAEHEKEDHSLHRPDASDGRNPTVVCGIG